MYTEHGNLRAALSWSLDEDAEGPGGQRAESGLRLAIAMYWFWQTHDYLTEGCRWLEMATSRRSNDPTTIPLRARALNGAAWFDRVLADRADVVAPDCEKVFVGERNIDALVESIPESFWEGLHPQFG